MGIAGVLHPRLERLVEQVADAPELGQHGLFVIVEAGPLQAVGGGQLRERLVRLADVGQGLGQGESELDPSVRRQGVGARRERAHLRQDRVVRRETAQGRQVLVEAWEGRLEVDRTLQRLDRLLGAAELGKQVTAVAVGLGDIGRAGDGGIVTGHRLIRSPQLLQRLALVVQRHRIGRVERQRRFVAGQRLGMTAQPLQHDAAIAEAGDVAGDEPQHPLEPGQRLRPQAAVHQTHGVGEPGGGVLEFRLGVQAHGFIRTTQTWPTE